jgi:hypothetical protein
MDNKDYHGRDNALDDYAGNVIPWEFAGQAFLFAAFATLVPIAGNLAQLLKISIAGIAMYVAVLSAMMSTHTLFQNYVQLHNFNETLRGEMGSLRSPCRAFFPSVALDKRETAHLFGALRRISCSDFARCAVGSLDITVN